MANITHKGDELDKLLNPDYGTTRESLEACSLICRAATTYGKIQELRCNVSMNETREEQVTQQEERLERRISDLVSGLDIRIKVKFGGDPRGYTVKLLLPSGRYNTWGGAEDGMGVPGS